MLNVCNRRRLLTRQLLSSSADRMMVPHFFPGIPLWSKHTKQKFQQKEIVGFWLWTFHSALLLLLNRHFLKKTNPLCGKSITSLVKQYILSLGHPHKQTVVYFLIYSEMLISDGYTTVIVVECSLIDNYILIIITLISISERGPYSLWGNCLFHFSPSH